MIVTGAAGWLGQNLVRLVAPTRDRVRTLVQRPEEGPLLELVARSAGSPQVILLTADEDVASWARLEALAGTVSVLEPTPDVQPVRARADGVA